MHPLLGPVLLTHGGTLPVCVAGQALCTSVNVSAGVPLPNDFVHTVAERSPPHIELSAVPCLPGNGCG